jgi:hypothetical protein
MTPEVTEEMLVDYLYGEVDDDQRKAIEAYLDAHPDKREELEALSQTRGILSQWTDEEPAANVVFVADDHRRFSRTTWRMVVGGAVAAAAALLMMFGDFEVGVRGGRFHFSAGGSASVQDTLSQHADRPLTVNEFAAVQKEYFELTKQLIEASELRQQQALMQVAGGLAEQRQQDLYLVGQGIRDVAQTTGYGFEQTGMLINRVHTLYNQP